MPDALVLEYLRTPRGKASPEGALAHLSAMDLLVALHRELVHRTGLPPEAVADVVIGVASQTGEQGADLARTALLMAGWPDTVPGVTLNRFCASGIDAVAQTASRIRAGDLDVAVAGGVESVSRVPIFSDQGALWTDREVIGRLGSVHMGIAADLVATVEGFTREALDAYAVQTHHKAARGWENGRYDRSVVALPGADGSPVSGDELIRGTITPDSLARLPPAFADVGARGQDGLVASHHPTLPPIEHTHTVGSSPPMADAAALLLLGSAQSAESLGVRPRARVVAVAHRAVDPVIMLTAGQQAAEAVIERAGLRPADIDVFEFAEAFSALCLRFARDLDAGPDRMNPNGGTMAMGHAFGATGAILVGQCVDELQEREGRYGVAAVSGAAGLGTAVLLERVG